jgi:Plants and Prokaryotes Conserved (PCC) domain
MAGLGAYHARGRFGKVVPVRLRPGTDVMDGLKQVCAQHKIKHAAILMGIGSLRQLSFQVLIPKPETKLGAGYTEPMVVQGPAARPRNLRGSGREGLCRPCRDGRQSDPGHAGRRDC